ncbi:MAG: patatin-like phospholipase family protein [Acidobacteriota bacterium]
MSDPSAIQCSNEVARQVVQPNSSSDETYRVGLVFAGAVSAGAYTAGVLDFLIQALDTWEAAKATGDEDVPPHRVLLKVMSGASAGAMTAGLAAMTLHHELEHVQSPVAGTTGNVLYDTWVRGIDLTNLLKRRDRKTAHLASLLDSTAIDRMARQLSKRRWSPRQRRAWVGDPVDLYLSVTNLRGVPYEIVFQGEGATGYSMAAHADYLHYQVGPTVLDEEEGAVGLVPGTTTVAGRGKWNSMIAASIASGAFPIGLAPRSLRRDRSQYDFRSWDVALDHEEAQRRKSCTKSTALVPSWADSDRHYEFLSVDGGLMDNEPLELARRSLSGGGRNPRDVIRSDRGVILIDPFPEPVGIEEIDATIPKVLLGMFMALKRQARFKPEELALALSNQVGSRFLIAPSRELDERPIAVSDVLACGTIGAFGGFLSEAYRRHDFLLGRRNCQKFLRDHFVLHPCNPLFSRWSESARASQASKQRNGFLRVIPLLGDCARELDQPRWPSERGWSDRKVRTFRRRDLNRLHCKVSARLNYVARRLIKEELHLKARLPARLAWRLQRGRVFDWIQSQIEHDLVRVGLLERR